MSDLIDRQVAIKELTEKVFYDYMDKLEALQVLDELPSVELRPKGVWIFGETNEHSWMKCSNCLKSQSGQTATFSFCPNCGAEMR